MNRNIKTTRSSAGKKIKRGKASVYTLARTHTFEVESLDELLEMHRTAEYERENAIKNIESLQNHLLSIEQELSEIKALIDMAKEDQGATQ